MSALDVLHQAGFADSELSGGTLSIRTPIDGAEIARIAETSAHAMPGVISKAKAAFLTWRDVPAPGAANWSACLARSYAHRRSRWALS